MARRATGGAGGNDHLVPVRKSVMHGGKTHMQTFYVKRGDVHSMVSKHGAYPKSRNAEALEEHDPSKPRHRAAAATIEHLGGDAHIAHRFVHDWSVGGSGHVNSIAYRRALADAGHLTHEGVERDMHRRSTDSKSTPEQYVAEARGAHDQLAQAHLARHGGEADIDHARARLADTAHALAQMSQAAHPEETVTLYRGVKHDQARALENADHLAVDTLSSWSEDPAVARGFAGIYRPETPGQILRITVPREQIVLSHRIQHPAFDTFHNEAEVVVAAPNGRIPITRENLIPNERARAYFEGDASSL